MLKFAINSFETTLPKSLQGSAVAHPAALRLSPIRHRQPNRRGLIGHLCTSGSGEPPRLQRSRQQSAAVTPAAPPLALSVRPRCLPGTHSQWQHGPQLPVVNPPTSPSSAGEGDLWGDKQRRAQIMRPVPRCLHPTHSQPLPVRARAFPTPRPPKRERREPSERICFGYLVH